MKEVSLVPFDEIDKVKWNSCIHYAVNGNIFGYHWYLTNAVRHWDALVYDDYKTVFPLISRKIFPGIHELYQPLLMGKLGVFSVNMLTRNKVNRMLQAIPDSYQGVRVQLNDINRLNENSPLHYSEERDHSLYLKPSYDQLYGNYSEHLKTILSEDQDWYFDNSIAPEDFVECMIKYGDLKFDKHTAHRLLYNGLHRGIAMILLLRDISQGFVAGALLMSSHGRLYHIMSAANPEADFIRARAFMWDRIIRTYADRPLILDFNMPGVDFPAELGAKPYDFFTLNKSNVWLQWTRTLSGVFHGLFDRT